MNAFTAGPNSGIVNYCIAKQTKIMKSYKAEQRSEMLCSGSDQDMKSYRAEQAKLVGDPMRRSLTLHEGQTSQTLISPQQARSALRERSCKTYIFSVSISTITHCLCYKWQVLECRLRNGVG